MDHLWSPWRLDYVTGKTPKGTSGCIFCDAIAGGHQSDLVVHRGPTCFVILNLYPYNNGHLMVVPNRHLARLSEATAEELHELIELTQLEEARKRKQRLEDEWKPKSAEHAALRAYLTDEWGRATTREEFDAAIPVLKEKVQALAKLDDRLGLRLAATVIEGGYVRIGDLLTGLDNELSQDRDEILKLQRTTAALRKVEELTRDELKRVDVPPKPDEKKQDEKKPEEKK